MTISPSHNDAATAARRGQRRAWGAVLTRYVFLTHRWVGIAVGLLMAAWCFSGIVMMYVGFPELTAQERQAGRSPIDMRYCCKLPVELATPETPVVGFRIESRAGTPILLLEMAGGGVIDLRRGARSPGIDSDTAFGVASDFGAQSGINGGIIGITEIEQDQWTIYSRFRAHRPLYKATFNDDAVTELYVSGTTGQVVQATDGRERFWNWFGAVTHWLYPTILRQHTVLWAQIVIWTSVAGIFLTVTGLYAGIRQFRRNSRKAISPYRGFSFWHHISGLVFGVFTLFWVASGLLSMNPWGLLEGSGAGREYRQLVGPAPTWAQTRNIIERLSGHEWEASTISLETAFFDGRAYLIQKQLDGTVRRLDAQTLAAAPLAQDQLFAAAARLRPDDDVQSIALMAQEDAYYFAHHDAAPLPVLRVIYADAEATRYYLDPVSGQLRKKVDRNARLYRWLHHGFHRLDFTGWLRHRPLWDLVMVPLMLGVTGLCVTGCYIGFRRLIRK